MKLKSYPKTTIVHISDLHLGSVHFEERLLVRAIDEINNIHPDVVIISGDLTNDGLRPQYLEVRKYLDQMDCKLQIVIPGNHDSRNVGYVHFEDMFGSRNSAVHLPGVTIVALDSTQPDLNEGKLGRQNYRWMVDQFTKPEDFKIVALHHHLLPVPGTGRERNIIEDAGDFLELLVEQDIDLALSGHKHVPYEWHFENLYLVNSGTVSSIRVRGYAQPCYNIMDIKGDTCRVHRKYPFGDSEEVVTFRIKPKYNPGEVPAKQGLTAT